MKKFSVIVLAAAAVGTAGCSDRLEDKALRVSIAPAIQTRVTGMYFDVGDRIGLTITRSSDVFAQNVPMTYDGSAFTGDGLLWYNDMNETSTLTAYYPYDESGAPSEFTVSADQTGGCESSDLLASVKRDARPASAPVKMIFSHLLSQLSVVVTNESQARVTGVTIGGFIPTARIDWQTPSATVKDGASAGEIGAWAAEAGKTYRAVLVPQEGELTVSVAADDGKSRSRSIRASLEGGRRYDMSVKVTDIDIEVSLSGEINDWVDGGSLDAGQDDGGDQETLSYGDDVYRTQKIGDRVWMAENLRYVPDAELLENGIWYPGEGTAPSEDPESVRQYGMLYSYAVATGGAASRAEGPVQGICPDGWHIPDAEELSGLIGCESGFFQCAGFWNSDSSRYGSNNKGYLMSSTLEGGECSCLSYLGVGGTPSVVPLSPQFGVSLRCVKNG